MLLFLLSNPSNVRSRKEHACIISQFCGSVAWHMNKGVGKVWMCLETPRAKSTLQLWLLEAVLCCRTILSQSCKLRLASGVFPYLLMMALLRSLSDSSSTLVCYFWGPLCLHGLSSHPELTPSFSVRRLVTFLVCLSSITDNIHRFLRWKDRHLEGHYSADYHQINKRILQDYQVAPH